MCLYKRDKSPYWWSEIHVGGRRFRRSTETSSRREAEGFERRWRDDLKAALKSAPKADPLEVLTLDKACGRYWKEHGRRLRAHADEARNLKYAVKFIGGDLPLRDLSNRHVHALRQARLDMGAGPRGVNSTLQTLQAVLNMAGGTWEEPVRVIGWRKHKLKTPKERVRWITNEEANRLIHRLDEFAPHIADVVRFLLLTGVRKDEAFNATWDRWNESAAHITLVVKGGHEREVALSADAVMLLRGIPKVSRYIFDTTNWRKHFERALREAAITNFRWHDLRHTYATWLGNSGAKIEVVSKSLGHSSLTVTMKYRHVLQGEVREAMRHLPTISTHTKNVLPLKKA